MRWDGNGVVQDPFFDRAASQEGETHSQPAPEVRLVLTKCEEHLV